MTLTREDAAAILGIKTDELRDVEDSPAGALLTTTDGCRFIVVPEDQPDANGNTGLMLLVAPNETGDWPMAIYAQPGAEATDSGPAAPAEPEPAKGKGIRSKAE